MADDPADILVIGAGASGAAFGWSVAGTGARVVCLEQGGWTDPADYPSTGRDWEARQLGEYHFSPNERRNAADYPVVEADSPIKIANFNGVGGGTALYAAHFPRFHPSDFRARTLDGVGDDWPIDYATLVPYDELNDRMMGVAGLAGDPGIAGGESSMLLGQCEVVFREAPPNRIRTRAATSRSPGRAVPSRAVAVGERRRDVGAQGAAQQLAGLVVGQLGQEGDPLGRPGRAELPAHPGL
jgi:choline dehydrogenase-like flavoprotein